MCNCYECRDGSRLPPAIGDISSCDLTPEQKKFRRSGLKDCDGKYTTVAAQAWVMKLMESPECAAFLSELADKMVAAMDSKKGL